MSNGITQIQKNSNAEKIQSLNYMEFINRYLRPDGQYGSQKKPLKELAAILGYNTPSILSMIISGHRLPSRSFIDQFSDVFHLSHNEKELFTLLVKVERAKRKGRDPEEIYHKISQLIPSSDTEMLDIKWFRSLSSWYYTAIKNLIKTPSFIEDDCHISKQLKGEVSPKQVREAIETMLRLGVIKRDESQKLYVCSKAWRTPNGVHSSAIRKYHKGMIEQALLSLKNEDMSKRYISGLTLQVDSHKKEEAMEDIAQFLRDFNQKYSSESSNQVAQLNIQFFGLNKALKERIQ